jgi:tetratricopeptide (TPR) repeat protein
MPPARLAPAVLVLAAALAVAAEPAAPRPAAVAPSDADLARAVERLGSGRYAEREQATKLLWSAGPRAEPLLQKALESGNPEIVRRAASLLEKFRWGLFPDTPPAVAELIGRYRTSDRDGKKAVASALLGKGRAGYAALKRLAAREENADDRAAVVGQMARDAQKIAAGLILAGDRPAVEELLEACLVGEGDDAPAHFAAFHALNGTLGPVIARFERERNAAAPKPPAAPSDPNPASARAAEVLVYLYRAKGDFDAARRMAALTYKDELLEAVLWEAGAWKELAARPGLLPRFRGTALGLQAAYERLGGDTAALTKTLDELRDQANADAADRPDLRALAEALCLNGRPGDAVNALLKRKKNLAMAFDLLAAQLRYPEALALAAQAGGDEEDAAERRELDLRRARALHLLGDRDGASQLFNQLGGSLRGESDARSAGEIVKVMARLGLRDAATDLAARYLAAAGPTSREAVSPVLEPLFPKAGRIAESWWRFLRQLSPAEPTEGTLRRLRGLLEKGRADDAARTGNADLMKKLADRAAEKGGDTAAASWEALAEAARVAGLADEELGYLRKAAEVSGGTGAWVKVGDALAKGKRPAEAALAYEKAVQRDPAQPLPVYLRGRALIESGDKTAGAALVEASHWLPLGNESVRAEFIEELGRRERTEDVRRETSLVLTAGWYRGWQVGNVLNHAARDAASRRQFRRAAELYEKSIVGCLRTGARFVETSAYLVVPQAVPHLRARALLAEGKLDAAVAEARGCLEVLPGNVDVPIHLWADLEKAGRKADAEALFARCWSAYETVLKDHPSSAFAHNSAAWLGANCRRRLDDALAHARKAVELSPQSAGYRDTLAEVHFRRGERAEAIRQMTKCREMEPDNDYFRRQLVRFEKEGFDSPVPESDDE